MYSDNYLADLKISRLSWEAKGIFTHIMCILRTQTDEPGYLKINGEIISKNDLSGILTEYQSRRNRGAKVVLRGIDEILKDGLLQQQNDGLLYSPRVVKEYEISELTEKGGKASVQRRAQRPVQLEEEKNKNKNTEQETTAQRSGSENVYKCTATHIHIAKELNEKWIKTFSEDPNTSYERFINFTKKFSQASINQALEVTQEKHINSGLSQPLKFFEAVCKNFQKEEPARETRESSRNKHIHHLTTKLCKELGLKPNKDQNPYYNQIQTIVSTTPQKQVIQAVQLTYQTENKNPSLLPNEDAFFKFFAEKVSEVHQD